MILGHRMASLLHVYPKETKTRCRHSISSSRVHCSIIRNVKQPRYENNLCPSTDEWTDRTWCDIYGTDYRSALGKKILPFATTRMDREGIALREITQRQTDKDCTYHRYHQYAGRGGRAGAAGESVQTFSYQMNEIRESNVQHRDSS